MVEFNDGFCSSKSIILFSLLEKKNDANDSKCMLTSDTAMNRIAAEQ